MVARLRTKTLRRVYHTAQAASLTPHRIDFGYFDLSRDAITDYGAGATVDVLYDREDREVGKKITCPFDEFNQTIRA